MNAFEVDGAPAVVNADAVVLVTREPIDVVVPLIPDLEARGLR